MFPGSLGPLSKLHNGAVYIGQVLVVQSPRTKTSEMVTVD